MNLNDADRASDELVKAIGSGRPENMARVAVAHFWPLFSAHFEMLMSVVTALPASLLDRHPLLRVLHPMTPVLARTSRTFMPVVSSEDARSMSPEELDFFVIAQMIAARFNGDVAGSLGYARRLEDRMLQLRVEARDRMDGPLWFFHLQIGSTLLAAGESSKALLEFATARQLGRLSIQADAERIALGRVALAHAVRGTVGDAERALADAVALPPVTAAHARAVRATESAVAALIGADRLSDDVDALLMALDPYDSIELSWPFALLARCRVHLARHQPEDAIEAIRLATDAHPPQQGSFAADVLAATSIDALLASGDLSWAWRTAEERGKAGVLSRLATIRLALQDGRLDTAEQELRLLAGEQSLGPAQRAESVLLSGWLALARTGALDRETALQISRIARRRDSRRLLAIIPRQLVEHVRDLLPDEAGVEFDAMIVGVSSVEMHARPALTVSERRVLNALPVHHSTAAMASAFHVSPNTVKSQLRSLYRKLGCSTRDEAVTVATRLRILVPDQASS
ncbi:LuxR C-terminal-related transcriptional regulator [Microbacterium sp. NPDC089189]|uniref:response regulator transcription factor n=1 Tax=Microbacterium sp. NPDC089189 TaxID=3154972 RepID=UPI00341FF4E9